MGNKTSYDFRTFFITIIYCLIFLSAIGQLRYQLNEQRYWYWVYEGSVFLIIFCCIIYIVGDVYINHGEMSLFEIGLLGFIFYEVLVSLFCGMLYIINIIIDILPWPLILIVSYSYFKYYDFPKSFKMITIIGLLIISLLSIPNISRHLANYGRRGGVVFPIYYGMSFLGMIFLLCKRRTQYLFMAIVTILLVVSTKRAGTAAVAIGLVFYFFCDAYIDNSAKERFKKYLGYFLILVIVAVIAIYLINYFNISIIDRFLSIQDDDASQRTYIWADVMQHFNDSSLMQKLFGHGYHAVYYNVQPYHFQRMAHNSFMETLYDYGIIGLLFLLIILSYIIITTIKMIRDKSKYAPTMMYTMSLLVVLGTFSYFFEQTIIITPVVIIWGACCGSYIRSKRELRYKSSGSSDNLVGD